MGIIATYMRLKNYGPPYAALHKKEIEIHFDKMMYKILLLLGVNGSCKTFILSHIHPFAQLGSVDVRNGEDIILPEKDGEKEIHYLDDSNGDKYRIIHYLQYQKRGRKVSSYIQKNGIELNPTGLVGSFNDVIEIEFGIDINFLKIIRLGSNVNNLIKLSSTERKEFVAKLLSDVDYYLDLFKKKSEKSKLLRSSIKIVTDKMKNLHIEDKTIHENDLDQYNKLLIEMRNKRDIISERFYENKGRILSSVKDKSYDEVMEEHECVSTELRDLEKIYSKKFNDLINGAYITNDINDDIEKIKEQISKLNINIEKTNADKNNLIQNIRLKEIDLMDSESKVKAFVDLDEIENIQSDLDEKQENLISMEKMFEGFKPNCTKEDILEDLVILENIINLMMNTFEYSQKAVNKYIEFNNKNNGVRRSCINKLTKLSIESDICDKVEKFGLDTDFTTVPYGCKLFNKCTFYNSYEIKSHDRSIKDIEDDIEIIKQCLALDDIIINMKNIFDSRKKKFPYTIKFENIFLDVINRRITFVNKKEINNYIAFLEQYDGYIKLKENISLIQKDLDFMYKQKETVDGTLVNRIEKLHIELSNYRQKLNINEKVIIEQNMIKDDLNGHLSYLEKNKSDMEESKEIYNEIKELRTKKDIARNNLNQYDEYKKLNFEYCKSKDEYDKSIKSFEDKIYDLKVRLSEYEKLRKEKEILEDEFEEIEIEKESLSANKGIPVLIINKYLKNTKKIANEIISKVYGEELKLKDFKINEKEFRMPYEKNGILVSDVSKASQGEESIISLALTFAILEEFTKKYKILLLDEVDGVLDKKNTDNFLRVLEYWMEKMDINQLICITHKKIFENFPIDIFITKSDEDYSKEYKHINRIN